MRSLEPRLVIPRKDLIADKNKDYFLSHICAIFRENEKKSLNHCFSTRGTVRTCAEEKKIVVGMKNVVRISADDISN